MSVIIPTHNREALLRLSLEALSAQTYPPGLLQVVVVADRCSDGTMDLLRRFGAPFDLAYIEQADASAAVARNRGASLADGEILIFLDDDIVAGPELVEAHALAHRRGLGEIILGELATVIHNGGGYFEAELRGWWDAMFERMREPGHRFTYRDLLTGNFSIRRERFNAYGGFDERLQCHEDYEFGARALEAGARFAFFPRAHGTHHEFTGVDRSLSRKVEEGAADVAIGRRHPRLRETLLMARLERYSLLPSRILQALAFLWPSSGRFVMDSLKVLLSFFDRLRIYGLWRRALYGLLGYAYWQGVAREIVSLREARKFARSPSPRPVQEMEVDLKDGVEPAETALDSRRPEALRVRYGGRLVAVIPAEPGAERLRGSLLRPLLATEHAIQLARAMALAGDVGTPEVKAQVAANLERIAQELRIDKGLLDG